MKLGERKRKKNERGAALIYLLFMITFMGIVLPLILLTVTQGQRHLVAYEAKQAAVYLSEGALEVVRYEMEQYRHETDEEQTGIYHFVNNIVLGHDPDDPLRQIEIDGQIISIGAALEQDGEGFFVTLFDLDYPEIKRTLWVTEGEGPGGGAPDPGEGGVPIFDDGRPDFVIPDDGSVYEEDHLGHSSRLCVGDDEEAEEGTPSCVEYINDHGGLYSDDRLIIGSNINLGYVQGGYDTIQFYGKEGIFISAEISTSSNQKMEFYSDQGDIYIGDGAVLDSSNELKVTAPAGHIVIEDGALNSSAYANVELEAGKYISLVDIQINSSRNVHLTATHMYIEESELNSISNGTIELLGHNSFYVKNAILDSSGLVELISGGWMQVINSELKSRGGDPILIESNTDMVLDGSMIDSDRDIWIQSGGSLSADGVMMKSVSWKDIVIDIGGDTLSLEQALLDADRDILVSFQYPSGIIYVSGLEIRSRNNCMQVTPPGIVLNGQPASGCVNL